MFNDKGEVLVMTMIPSDPDYGGTEPQMAKGGLDDGMTLKQTAIKEAEEEVGLKMKNLKNIKFMGNEKANKPIAVYFGEIIDEDDFNEPHWETGWSGWINISTNLNAIRQEQFKNDVKIATIYTII